MCKLLAFSNMEQAFYRKYRPQNLDEMVGQDEAVALISSQISDDKIGHAYLFSGPKGVGKTSLARIIAKELGCDPIFDVSEIDAASHNKVDDIRDMNESVNFIATSPGKKRIFILDEVHMLSNAASNAFLKTLEEPPEHVIFILATTEPDRVIETIRSRTTQVVFKKILDEKIINVLELISKKEKINFKKDILQIIASYSDGSLRDAINLLEQANNTFGSNLTVENIFSLVGKLGSSELDQIIESIEFQDTSKVLSVIRDAYSKGLQPSDITNSVSEFFRNLFYLKYLPDDEKLKSLSENFSKNLEKANEKISAKQLVRILDLIDEINSTLPVSNSQHLKLELFMMKLVKPEFGSDVKSIGYRLDLLEGQSNLSHPTTDDESDLNNSIKHNEAKPEPKKKEKKSTKKQSIEDFDIFWPKILNSLKEILSSRKFSYLTSIKPEVGENGDLTLLVDKNNEFLFDELKKSSEITDLVKSEIAKLMGIEINVIIEISETANKSEDGGITAAQEIFDVEDLS